MLTSKSLAKDNIEIPRLLLVKQTFPRPKVQSLEDEVFKQLSKIERINKLTSGAKVAVTAGSRGISNIAEITGFAVKYFKEKGLQPKIIPAMGSHGGATPEGQAHLLEHYGISEETMGAPVDATLDVISLGKTKEGVEAFLAKSAFESDGVLLLNRIKAHTDYKGTIESGLTKICGIGLGKLRGAQQYHSFVFGIGLGAAIKSATAKILESGKILGGLGIIENAYHETAKLAAVSVDNFFEEEKALLAESKELMPSLPLKEIDVLLLSYLGKNISGAGMDTNIIGRSVRGYTDDTSWMDYMPVVCRIIVEDITDESDGNAVGVGTADFITEKFKQKINYRITTLNAVTALCPQGAKMPVVMASTYDALQVALGTSPFRKEGPFLVYAQDTLSLDTIYVSENCRSLLTGRNNLEISKESQDLKFDAENYLVSPFAKQHH